MQEIYRCPFLDEEQRMMMPPGAYMPEKIRTFYWDDPILELRLISLCIPPYDLDEVLKHRGEQYDLYVREGPVEMDWNASFPQRGRPERWEFRTKDSENPPAV